MTDAPFSFAPLGESTLSKLLHIGHLQIFVLLKKKQQTSEHVQLTESTRPLSLIVTSHTVGWQSFEWKKTFRNS